MKTVIMFYLSHLHIMHIQLQLYIHVLGFFMSFIQSKSLSRIYILCDVWNQKMLYPLQPGSSDFHY